MSYNVIVAPDALDGLRHVEGGIRLEMLSCILSCLQDLGENPAGKSQRPLIPYPEAGQVFPFTCSVEGTNHLLVAIFTYAESEEAIHVLRIRYARTPPL